MSSAIRRIQRRRKARDIVSKLMSDPEHVVVIHYSCESFYDRPDGSSPRITSIAVRNLYSAQTRSFSIHQIAEINGYPLDDVEEHYDELERQMLDAFYEYVSRHQDHMWLHWNMRDINYGFQAIAHRYRVLGGNPAEIHESRLVDLSRLLVALYGRDYVAHPRMQKLIEKNGITKRDFLAGAEEAVAFENQEYVKLHFSTLRKVDILAGIVERVDEESLVTNSTWKDIYGLYPAAAGEWLQSHWLPTIIITLLTVAGFIISILN